MKSLFIPMLLVVLCLGVAFEAFPELPEDRLVAHWTFDEGNGKSTSDVINDHKGQIQDANWVDGKAGKALEFDGDKSFVLVNDADNLKNFPEGLTVEAWVMLKGNIDELSSTVIRKHPEYTLEVLGTKNARATVNGLWGAEWLTGKTSLQPDTWYHLAMTCDINNRRLYVSGKMEDEKAGVDLVASGDAIGIGKNVSQDIYFFPGIIDEVKIWNIALDADQIKESMEGVAPGAVEPFAKLSVKWSEIKL